MRIDKQQLWLLLKPYIETAEVLWLCKLLVFHDSTENYTYKGKPGLLQQMPSHKSLLQCELGKGLPIGNLNSQFFANVYLNCLDQFVKHQLKCRYYLRYCDDFVLLDTDPERLCAWREQIWLFLQERLQLELNDRSEKLRPTCDGVDFLGYIVCAEYRLVRRRVVNNLRCKLNHFAALLVKPEQNYGVYRFDQAILEQCRATVLSWSLASKPVAGLPVFGAQFGIDAAYLSLQPLYEAPKRFDCTRWQYNWLKNIFRARCCFFKWVVTMNFIIPRMTR